MAMGSRREDWLTNCFFLAGTCAVIVDWFGTKTLVLTAAGLLTWAFGGIAHQVVRRRRAPCDHGTRGAAENPAACERCVAEQRRRDEQDERVRQLEAERRDDRRRLHIAERERERAEAERRDERTRIKRMTRAREERFLLAMGPAEFEQLVCDIYRAKGYAVRETPRSADHGVDGLFERHGTLYVMQAKRYRGAVGEPVLRDLYGTMHHLGADRGILVTTGHFSGPARAWAKDKPITLVDLKTLRSLIRHGLPDAYVRATPAPPPQGTLFSADAPAEKPDTLF